MLYCVSHLAYTHGCSVLFIKQKQRETAVSVRTRFWE